MKYNGKSIQWVWFDLDDTLIDFTSNSKAALAKLYVEARLDRWFADAAIWTERYEGHNHPLWDSLARGEITTAFLRMERFRRPLADAGCSDVEARRLSTDLDPLYLDLLAHERGLVPGAKEILRKVREAGVHTGILSNGFKDVQHRKIEHAGLSELIDLTVLSDDIDVQKPDTRLYIHAMERAGITDHSAHLMIGDNPDTDIAGALRAGWQAILLQPQHPDKSSKPVPAGAASAATLADATEMLGM